MKQDNLPVIYISQYAYDKIIYALKNIKTEVSGFGILSQKDPLIVDDFYVPKQENTSYHTEMDDNSVADFVDDYIDKGYEPWQLQRIWIHTHPAGIASPSAEDENTFKRCFGRADFAVMLIFAKSGEISCTIHINSPIRMTIPAKIAIDNYEVNSDFKEMLKKNVKTKKVIIKKNKKKSSLVHNASAVEIFDNDDDELTEEELAYMDYMGYDYNEEKEDWEDGLIQI